MKEIEEIILKAIFGWTKQRFIALSIGLSVFSTMLLLGVSMLPFSGRHPAQWWEIAFFFVAFGPFVTTAAFLYFRFVKGPAVLARLKSKQRNDAVNFCLNLMKE